MEELDSLNNETNSWGGKREGAGRPEGSRNAETLERDRVFNQLRQRIMKKADRILNAQLSLAEGQQFLYKIDTHYEVTGPKGGKTRVRSKPKLVTEPDEIAGFLDGEYGDGDSPNTETKYYFITTKEPVNNAIDSMFDRTFDKAKQSTDITTGGDKIVIPIYGGLSNNNSNNKDIPTDQEN